MCQRNTVAQGRSSNLKVVKPDHDEQCFRIALIRFIVNHAGRGKRRDGDGALSAQRTGLPDERNQMGADSFAIGGVAREIREEEALFVEQARGQGGEKKRNEEKRPERGEG